eukprot:scaffold1439_cov78-Phaeocystis_antarctica.AAC.2
MGPQRFGIRFQFSSARGDADRGYCVLYDLHSIHRVQSLFEPKSRPSSALCSLPRIHQMLRQSGLARDWLGGSDPPPLSDPGERVVSIRGSSSIPHGRLVAPVDAQAGVPG